MLNRNFANSKEMHVSDHYDEEYFNNQNRVGKAGGKLNAGLFSPYIKPSDSVLEFGCGGGWLLAGLKCGNKIGLEINPSAIDFAKNVNQLTIYDDVSLVPDDWADVIISNHALEHSRNPFYEISSLKPKLKKGGKIVFIVPHETIRREWHENSLDNHLYTWSPSNLGNLFKEAGYKVIECKPLYHKFPPYYLHIVKIGDSMAEVACRIWGLINRNKMINVRIICDK